VSRQTILGTAMSIVACDRCRGRGRVVVSACEHCRGRGSITEDVSVTVQVPAGIEDGGRLRIPGLGAAGEAGSRPGDLYVEVQVERDARFVRHGADLVHRIHLGVAQAALGADMSVPTVDGDRVDITIPPGTQPGTVFKLSRQGMPRLRGRGRGDLLVEVVVEVPTELTKQQEAALRAFAESMMGEAPAPGRRRRR
jgi:molecular chaperone DnaJ